MTKREIIVLTGVSGSGKTTLSQIFPREQRLVSFTTRTPRPNEIDGIDYYFISKKQAVEIINSNNLFESTVFGNNYYGITEDEVLDKSQNFKNHTILVAEAGFYKDVTLENGTFLFKGLYPIRPILVESENYKIIQAIKERGGEDTNLRIANLAKEEKSILALKEKYGKENLETFKVYMDDGIPANQKRFEEFLNLKRIK